MMTSIDKIMANGIALAKSSWEFGAASEALIQLRNAELSVFGRDPFQAATQREDHTEVSGLVYAQRYIQTDGPFLTDGDGSAGDTAALGVYCTMLGIKNTTYQEAAGREVAYLLQDTPRWANGAISHRSEYPELWADFVFMAPPFLAYEAVVTRNEDLFAHALNQCILYADVLSDGRLWKHIIGPHDKPQKDPGLWATGNGWVAAGLTRVIATATRAKPIWSSVNDHSKEVIQLAQLVAKLLDGAITSATNGSPPLLCNYLDDPSYFGDVASTALIAASAFRLAHIMPEACERRHIEWAEQAWKNIEDVIAPRDGSVGPTPMPGASLGHTPSEVGSSQGHSFVVMCFAARRDWLESTGGLLPT